MTVEGTLPSTAQDMRAVDLGVPNPLDWLEASRQIQAADQGLMQASGLQLAMLAPQDAHPNAEGTTGLAQATQPSDGHFSDVQANLSIAQLNIEENLLIDNTQYALPRLPSLGFKPFQDSQQDQVYPQFAMSANSFDVATVNKVSFGGDSGTSAKPAVRVAVTLPGIDITVPGLWLNMEAMLTGIETKPRFISCKAVPNETLDVIFRNSFIGSADKFWDSLGTLGPAWQQIKIDQHVTSHSGEVLQPGSTLQEVLSKSRFDPVLALFIASQGTSDNNLGNTTALPTFQPAPQMVTLQAVSPLQQVPVTQGFPMPTATTAAMPGLTGLGQIPLLGSEPACSQESLFVALEQLTKLGRKPPTANEQVGAHSASPTAAYPNTSGSRSPFAAFSKSPSGPNIRKDTVQVHHPPPADKPLQNTPKKRGSGSSIKSPLASTSVSKEIKKPESGLYHSALAKYMKNASHSPKATGSGAKAVASSIPTVPPPAQLSTAARAPLTEAGKQLAAAAAGMSTAQLNTVLMAAVRALIDVAGKLPKQPPSTPAANPPAPLPSNAAGPSQPPSNPAEPAKSSPANAVVEPAKKSQTKSPSKKQPEKQAAATVIDTPAPPVPEGATSDTSTADAAIVPTGLVATVEQLVSKSDATTGNRDTARAASVTNSKVRQPLKLITHPTAAPTTDQRTATQTVPGSMGEGTMVAARGAPTSMATDNPKPKETSKDNGSVRSKALKAQNSISPKKFSKRTPGNSDCKKRQSAAEVTDAVTESPTKRAKLVSPDKKTRSNCVVAAPDGDKTDTTGKTGEETAGMDLDVVEHDDAGKELCDVKRATDLQLSPLLTHYASPTKSPKTLVDEKPVTPAPSKRHSTRSAASQKATMATPEVFKTKIMLKKQRKSLP